MKRANRPAKGQEKPNPGKSVLKRTQIVATSCRERFADLPEPVDPRRGEKASARARFPAGKGSSFHPKIVLDNQNVLIYSSTKMT